MQIGAVRLFVTRARAADPHFSPDRQTIAIARGHLPPAGRHSARDRTGRRAHRGAWNRRSCGPARRPLPAADGRPPDGAAAPADVARHARLELRAAARSRAHSAAPPGGVRWSLQPGSRERAWPRVTSSGASDVVDCIVNLVAKSLLSVVGSAVAQYRLLETTRAYALDKLTQSGRAAPLRAPARRAFPRRVPDRCRRMGNQQHQRMAGPIRPADRQPARGAGLGVLPRRRCRAGRGPDGRGDSAVDAAVPDGRVPRACRAGAGEPRRSKANRAHATACSSMPRSVSR